MADLMGALESDWWVNYRVLKTNMDPNGVGSVKVTEKSGLVSGRSQVCLEREENRGMAEKATAPRHYKFTRKP